MDTPSSSERNRTTTSQRTTQRNPAVYRAKVLTPGKRAMAGLRHEQHRISTVQTIESQVRQIFSALYWLRKHQEQGDIQSMKRLLAALQTCAEKIEEQCDKLG